MKENTFIKIDFLLKEHLEVFNYDYNILVIYVWIYNSQNHEFEWGLTTLSNILHIPKSTIARKVKYLIDKGLLIYDGNRYKAINYGKWKDSNIDKEFLTIINELRKKWKKSK